MPSFTFIDLFAGIGGMRMACEQNGGKCVFSSEKDKFAQQTYYSNFGEMPVGDITKVEPKDIPDHDLLMAGFPCQPFSTAGLKLGFADIRGTLFFEIVKILKEKRPKAFLLENVQGLISNNGGKTFETILTTLKSLNYIVFWNVLNSALFVPQNRKRVFIVGFDKEQVSVNQYGFFSFYPLNVPHGKIHPVKNILEKNADTEKYTISARSWSYIQKHSLESNYKHALINFSRPTRTLLAGYNSIGGQKSILVPQNGKNPRSLTPRECARLQGFPDTFKIVVSDSQSFKQFGNSVTVPLIKEIVKKIIKVIK